MMSHAVISCTSSRFNSLSRQSTDSLLVEFTQTKSPRLHTKQTSMYSFFSAAGNRNKQSCITNINASTQETSLEFEERHIQEAPNVMNPSANGPSTCLKQSHMDCEAAENQGSVYKTHRNPAKLVSSGGNENDDRSRGLGKPGNHNDGSVFNSLNPPTNCWAIDFGSMYQDNLSDSSKCHHKDCNTEDIFPPSQCEGQLFTQDTQGNRVICHRHTNCMSAYSAAPLQDKTNVAWDTRSSMKGIRQSLCDEDSLQKMFTQDSEGKMVIKH